MRAVGVTVKALKLLDFVGAEGVKPEYGMSAQAGKDMWLKSSADRKQNLHSEELGNVFWVLKGEEDILELLDLSQDAVSFKI